MNKNNFKLDIPKEYDMYTHILLYPGHPEKHIYSDIIDLLTTTTVAMMEGQ